MLSDSGSILIQILQITEAYLQPGFMLSSCKRTGLTRWRNNNVTEWHKLHLLVSFFITSSLWHGAPCLGDRANTALFAKHFFRLFVCIWLIRAAGQIVFLFFSPNWLWYNRTDFKRTLQTATFVLFEFLYTESNDMYIKLRSPNLLLALQELLEKQVCHWLQGL
jgi:hypothetical protein